MSMGADLQSTLLAARPAVMAPRPTVDPVAAKRVAQDFESVFITQMLGQMYDGVSTDGPFGGGPGEEMFRSLLLDQYGKQVAAQGGFGLASQVTRELLGAQEAHGEHGFAR